MSHIHPDAFRLIEKFGLLPHPEGGYFRETYRAEDRVGIIDSDPDPGFAASTAIFFLVTGDNFSAFHRIRFDEMWHFYAGDPLEIIELDQAGQLKVTLLGPATAHGCTCQHLVRGGTWFASRMAGNGSWALTGCTVAPGFEFDDFEIASRKTLTEAYPLHAKLIHDLTRA